MNAFYRFALGVVRVVFPLWYHIDIQGKENIPQDGGYLFISNHRSLADPVLIGMQTKKIQFSFLAKQELFAKPMLSRLFTKLGAIAVDRGAGDLSPIEELKIRLNNGHNALIFPEGTRSKDGTLGKFKTGAALLAAQTGVPVVPAAITFEGKLHFRSKIVVSFGKPFEVSVSTPDDPQPKELKSVKLEMTKAVSDLLPPLLTEQSDDRT